MSTVDGSIVSSGPSSSLGYKVVMDVQVDDEWVDPQSLAAMTVATGHGMPARSLAVYSRWWQLETWLRELVYVELRAKYGLGWEGIVSRAAGRQAQDDAFAHMASADSRNPLAYLDYSQLLQVIDENWQLFGPTLIERRSWNGRQEDLKRIRHRMGHMRFPHGDDLSRVEQTLRDLERGTFIALASYNRRFWTDGGEDAVSRGWIDEQHHDARRLIAHADRQYETRLMLRWSRRPWAADQPLADPAPGLLWHADFVTRGRSVDAASLWRDSAMSSVRPLLVHLVADDPWSVGFTFSAADPGEDIADAIGAAFDAVLMNSRPTFATEPEVHDRGESARGIDYRVVHKSGWSIVDESTVPITSFGAGGGVTQAPTW